MKTLYIFLTLLMLTGSVVAKNKGRGKQEVLQCIDSKYTYSIILPSTYEKKPDKKFPALFISSPNGKAKSMGLDTWAEENEVMIILNRTTKNGLEDDYSNALKALMKTVESKYRIHPFLRFSTGVSGGAEVSAHVAVDYPKKWSGVVLQAHSGNGRYPPKHCAVAFLAGEKDKVHSIGAVRAAYKKLKDTGNSVHITVYPDRGHKAGLREDVIKELTWMLNLKRYNHPSINSAYIKQITPEIEKKIAEIPKIEDNKKKIEEIDKLLLIPWITSMKGYKELGQEYIIAKLEEADQESNELDAWVIFTEISNSDLFSKADRKLKNSVLLKLRKLARNPDVLKEKGVMTKYYRAYKLQQKYNSSKRKSAKNKQRIIKEYKSILDRYSDSLAAKKAKEAMQGF